ncbi:CPBP family intramembrane glutamic endopeptidase [Halocatena pleomorpha]|uniref:CPBP family intramembrane metalloprotease n=1 Tax=Halocatena pleomorpha TaxID=1785090 RepID=A0A3P3R6G9_9EURY|nr:CPBP family intramembrane glutamic endopeptidase [Halocatena pleomorpha]RRJ28965.1 CPBP family intramembrane metalloprotease [Halocatena pleomorpha]
MVPNNTSSQGGAYDRLRSIVVVMLLVVSALLLAGVAVVPLLFAFSAVGIAPTSTVGYVILIVEQQLVFGLVAVVYAIYTDPELIAVRRPTVWGLGWIVVGIVLLLGTAQLISVLLRYGGFMAGTNQIEQIARVRPQLLLYLIPLAIVLIGPGEELLFRAGVQGRLRRSFGALPAIVLASALFGLVHVPAVATSTTIGVGSYVFTAFVLGLVLGGLYERTNNLLVPALTHGVYNAILFGALYASLTGIG